MTRKSPLSDDIGSNLELEVDYFATGHYCQIAMLENNYFLQKGLDLNKDQSLIDKFPENLRLLNSYDSTAVS